jgi:hypothetical protein
MGYNYNYNIIKIVVVLSTTKNDNFSKKDAGNSTKDRST